MSVHPSAMTPTEPAKPDRPTRVRWRIVGLLLAFSIASYILRVNITIAGEPIMHEFHLTPVRLGWVFSAFLISYTAFMTPAGTWADRFGPRLVLAAAGLSWAVLTLLTALLPGFVFASATGILGSLLVVRLLLGICEAPTYPGAARAIAYWVSKSERAFANAVVITGALFGSAITAPLVSYLMVHLGWRNAMMVISIVGPALVLIWLLYATDQPREHPAISARELAIIGTAGTDTRQSKPPPDGWRTVLKSGQAWRLSAAYGCQGYVNYIFIWWCYIYLVEVRKFSLVRGGLATAAPFILSTFTTPAAGALSDWLIGRLGHRQGRRIIPVLALAAAAILVFVGARVEDARLAVIILSIGAALAWTPEGPIWASMMEIASPMAGAAGGFLNTGGNFGGALATFFTPWIAKQIGWIGAFGVASLFAIVGSFLWVGVDPTRPIVVPAPAEVTRPVGSRISTE